MEAQEADGTGTQASEDRLKGNEAENTTNGEVISNGMLFLSTRHTIFGLQH